MEVKVKKSIFILLVFVLFVSCSLFDSGRSANNISDWFPEYEEGAIITYSVIDSLHRTFENDTIKVDNYSRKNYQATETIVSITNNSEKTIVCIDYADNNDSTATYHLICDKDNNRINITFFKILIKFISTQSIFLFINQNREIRVILLNIFLYF